MLYKIRNFAPLRILHSLYYALFHSHLSYGICVWGNATKTLLEPLLLAQKRIVRIISNSGSEANTNPIFNKLDILKVDDIFKHQIGSLMWDLENKKLTNRFSDLFLKVNKRHEYGTRLATSNKFCTDFRQNTNTHGDKLFRNYGSKLWNCICDQSFYKTNHSKVIFRKKFKEFLISLQNWFWVRLGIVRVLRMLFLCTQPPPLQPCMLLLLCYYFMILLLF